MIVLGLGDGKLEQARDAWDALLATELSTLNARRLVLGSAITREALGDNEGAYAVLEQAINEAAPFDVRGMALVSRGILADRLGRREHATQQYEAALEHFSSRPEFTASAPLQHIAKRGLKSSQGKMPLLIRGLGVPQ